MRVAIVVVVALAGCIEADVQRCGERICPPTQVCIDDTRCVDPDALAVCAGIDDGVGCVLDDQYGRCAPHATVGQDQLVCDPAVCGDGVIDMPLNERCDGAAPFATQCVDVGYDIGRLACTETCELDAAPCTRFGWDTVVAAPVYQMWTDGVVLAYATYYPQELVINGGGFAVEELAFPRFITGNAGVVFVATYNTLLRFDAGTRSEVTPPFTIEYVNAIAVDSAGVLFALHGCDLWAYDGTWKLRTTLPQSSCNGFLTIAPGGALYAQAQDAVYEITPSGPALRFNIPSAPQVHDFAARTTAGGFGVFAATDIGVYRWSPTDPVEPIINGKQTSLAFTSTHVYALSAGVATRWDALGTYSLRSPASVLVDDGANHVYSFGGPIFRFSGTSFSEVELPSLANIGDRFVDVVELPTGGALYLANHQTFTLDGGKWTDHGDPLAPMPMRALGALDIDHFAISGYLDPPFVPMGQLWVEDMLGSLDQVYPPGAPLIDGLWMASDGTVFAAGVQPTTTTPTLTGFLGRWTPPLGSGTWTSKDLASCEMHGVDGLSLTDVWAVGACDGVAVIWHFDGTAWTEAHRDPAIAAPLFGVKVFPGGVVFAVGDGGAVWNDGAWHGDAAVRGRSLSGSVANLWVTGLFSTIQHFDGVGWSRMTTHAVGQMVVVATPSAVVFAGGAPGFVALVREP